MAPAFGDRSQDFRRLRDDFRPNPISRQNGDDGSHVGAEHTVSELYVKCLDPNPHPLQAWAIGIRRPGPKALPVILRPGGICRRLYSLS